MVPQIYPDDNNDDDVNGNDGMDTEINDDTNENNGENEYENTMPVTSSNFGVKY